MYSRAAAAEVYSDLSRDLERQCRNFATRRGLDPEELVAEGNLHFLRAYRRHRLARDPRPFDRYAHYFVRKQLLERARKEARRGRLLPRVPLEDVEEMPKFDLGLFLADLGRDAATVVKLLVRTGVRRSGLKNRLKTKGWSSERIERSFRQIREALS